MAGRQNKTFPSSVCLCVFYASGGQNIGEGFSIRWRINMNDEQLEELWEERAAIRQYDGEFSKEFAEYLAARDIRKIAGRIPNSVLLKVMQDGPVRNGIKNET